MMTETLVCLALGSVVFPALYLSLCAWMYLAVPNPPFIPYFFIFGTLGGYSLISVLSPSPLALLVFLPFIPCALLGLVCSFVLSMGARPRSRFHRTAAWISGLALSSVMLLLVIGSLFDRLS